MQPNELVSLVYVSSSAGEMNPAEILAILHTSRENNQRADITGMLLHKGGNFMQVLEGPDEQVSKLFAKVTHDPRHRGVLQLIKKPIERRNFAEWSMAFENLDGLQASECTGYSPFLSSSLLDEEFRSRPESCYKLLLCFKQGMR